MVYKTDESLTFDGCLKDRKKRMSDAERIDYNHFAYDALFGVNEVCFDGFFQFLPLFWLPDDTDSTLYGRFGRGAIWIHKQFDQSDDEALITLIWHEMIHGYCGYKQIADTDGEYHTEAFRHACEDHGGSAGYNDSIHGYNDTALHPETMQKIKQRIQRCGMRAVVEIQEVFEDIVEGGDIREILVYYLLLCEIPQCLYMSPLCAR